MAHKDLTPYLLTPYLQAAYASGGYTMAQLAAHFGLHYTSVSRIVKLIEGK